MRVFRAGQYGFSLFELLIVVMLIGLLGAVMVSQGNWVSNDQALEQESDRLRDTLALLNERSLFSGQLLAQRLTSSGWEPLVFDMASNKFQPVEDSVLKPHELSTGLQLTWQIDELGDELLDLRQVAKSLVQEEVLEGVTDGMAADQNDSEAEAEQKEESDFPQVFFFPSGEATPVTMSLYPLDNTEYEVRLQLSPLGKITNLVEGEGLEKAL